MDTWVAPHKMWVAAHTHEWENLHKAIDVGTLVRPF